MPSDRAELEIIIRSDDSQQGHPGGGSRSPGEGCGHAPPPSPGGGSFNFEQARKLFEDMLVAETARARAAELRGGDFMGRSPTSMGGSAAAEFNRAEALKEHLLGRMHEYGGKLGDNSLSAELREAYRAVAESVSSLYAEHAKAQEELVEKIRNAKFRARMEEAGGAPPPDAENPGLSPEQLAKMTPAQILAYKRSRKLLHGIDSARAKREAYRLRPDLYASSDPDVREHEENMMGLNETRDSISKQLDDLYGQPASEARQKQIDRLMRKRSRIDQSIEDAERDEAERIRKKKLDDRYGIDDVEGKQRLSSNMQSMGFMASLSGHGNIGQLLHAGGQFMNPATQSLIAEGGMTGTLAAAGPLAMAAIAGARMVSDATVSSIRGAGQAASSFGRLDAGASTDLAMSLTSKVLDPLGMGISPVNEGLKEAKKQLDAFNAAVMGTAEKLAPYSGALSAAFAMSEVRQVMGDMRRANFLGTDLARVVDANSRLQEAGQSTSAIVLRPVLERYAGLLEKLANKAEQFEKFAERNQGEIEEKMGRVVDWTTTATSIMFPVFGLLLTALRKWLGDDTPNAEPTFDQFNPLDQMDPAFHPDPNQANNVIQQRLIMQRLIQAMNQGVLQFPNL